MSVAGHDTVLLAIGCTGVDVPLNRGEHAGAVVSVNRLLPRRAVLDDFGNLVADHLRHSPEAVHGVVVEIPFVDQVRAELCGEAKARLTRTQALFAHLAGGAEGGDERTIVLERRAMFGPAGHRIRAGADAIPIERGDDECRGGQRHRTCP